MLDNPADLLEKIRLGEDSVLELKEVRFEGKRIVGPPRDALANELAAMANATGGICLLGVEDSTRRVLGVPPENLDLLEAFVSELANDSIAPPLVLHIQRISLPSQDGTPRAVLKLEIPKSLFVHQSPGGYFLRTGSSKRKMGPELLARLFQQRSQARLIRFDETEVADATLSDLDPASWQRFRTPLTEDPDEAFLLKLGVAARASDEQLRPTVAGILMASREPRRFLPNAFVQAVAYRGTEIAPEGANERYQLDARDISGPLDEQIIEACRFVHRNMKIGATKDMGRNDIPQFDMQAVFEAVTNAAVHRDYSIYGSKIRLRMFADRLELYSPGAIVNTLTVDALAYRQFSRNETISSLLARTPVPKMSWLQTRRERFMDRRGEGVPVILNRSRELSGRIPEYKLFDETELRLTIWAA